MTCDVHVSPETFAMVTGIEPRPSGEVQQPARAIVFLFGDGEKITGARIRDRLIARDYAIVHRPVIVGHDGRTVSSISAAPDPAAAAPSSAREPQPTPCGWCGRSIYWTVDGDAHSWGRCIGLDEASARARSGRR